MDRLVPSLGPVSGQPAEDTVAVAAETIRRVACVRCPGEGIDRLRYAAILRADGYGSGVMGGPRWTGPGR